MKKLKKLQSSMPKDYLKSKIGIIGGGNIFDLNILKKTSTKSVSTPYGKVNYYLFKTLFIICRHGIKKNIPPHKINYRANIFAFKKLGIKHIFSFTSVGSLKKEISPGSFLIPDDYIGFDILTFYDRERKHITPGISPKLRSVLIKILSNLKIKFRKKGIYFETKGPRLETKAEINLIKKFADVVGMTLQKEATLAKELDIEYASLCSVDNYAHGVVKKSLTEEEIRESQKKSKKKIEKIIKELLSLNDTCTFDQMCKYRAK